MSLQRGRAQRACVGLRVHRASFSIARCGSCSGTRTRIFTSIRVRACVGGKTNAHSRDHMRMCPEQSSRLLTNVRARSTATARASERSAALPPELCCAATTTPFLTAKRPVGLYSSRSPSPTRPPSLPLSPCCLLVHARQEGGEQYPSMTQELLMTSQVEGLSCWGK